jgi:hypothetical protein
MNEIRKDPMVPSRVRRIPDTGFSWIDRRFVHDGFISSINSNEIALYFFLCSVADKNGVSFFGVRRIACVLRLTEDAVERARIGLMRSDLIAYRHPLYQVLSLPAAPSDCPTVERTSAPPQSERRAASDASSIGDILRGLR